MRLAAISELPTEIVASLEEHGIKTDTDFLSMAAVDILHKLPIGTTTLVEINRCKDTAARVSAAPGYTTSSLMELAPRVLPSTMNTAFPLSLGPIKHYLAAHSGRVVELSGDRDSRKSEFTLNIILCYLATHACNTAHWVDTAGNFSVAKASSISTRFAEDGGQTCLERIQLSLALEVEQLYDVLDDLSGDHISTTGYLVVDSITALLGPLLSATSSQGHALMTDLIRQLRIIAQTHSITVIVINNSTGNYSVQGLHELIRKPALGPTFTFLTDATLWMTGPSLAHHQIPDSSLPSEFGKGDHMEYRLEVLKSNVGAAGAAGSCVLRSGFCMLPDA